MTQEAAVPATFYDAVRRMVREEISAYARSGSSRNSSITGGRFTIKGGALVVEHADGSTSSYWGPITPALPDGTYQPGFIVRREDGTLAAALYDPTPDPSTPDGFQQFLALYDRAEEIVVSDDTDSGQGLARPYVPIPVTRARYTDMPAVTDGAFVDVFSTPGVFHKVNARASGKRRHGRRDGPAGSSTPDGGDVRGARGDRAPARGGLNSPLMRPNVRHLGRARGTEQTEAPPDHTGGASRAVSDAQVIG